jgi:hypothetical protein
MTMLGLTYLSLIGAVYIVAAIAGSFQVTRADGKTSVRVRVRRHEFCEICIGMIYLAVDISHFASAAYGA